MPVSEKVLQELVERIGPQHRESIVLAVQHEQKRDFEKALQEWESIYVRIRKAGKDTAPVQHHLQRLHKLLWQKGIAPRTDAHVDTDAHQPLDGSQAKSYAQLRNAIRTELQNRCVLQDVDFSSPTTENRDKIRAILDQSIKERLRDIPDWVKRKDLIEDIMNEVLGLGILEEYLHDSRITEIMVNRTEVYIERDGRIFPAPRSFEKDEEVRKIVERILAPIGRRVDESFPLAGGRLADGSRVNVAIPPVAIDGPMITIRKFTPRFFSVENLIDMKTLSTQMAAFLKFIVEERKNIIVTGRTSSGKTTLLNMLAGFIPAGERIITIEEMAELQLPKRHVVRLEARPPNIQGKGEITIRTLFRNALHMRPDRIIVGECRGVETLDMLQAMNTGHDGSLSTAHSNSPRDLLVRLEAMVSMSDIWIDARTLQRQIASGVDVIIYCARFPDGQRKITSISEVALGKEGEILVHEMYQFHGTGTDERGSVQGEFVPTGYIPTFVQTEPSLLKSDSIRSFFDRDKAAHFEGTVD